MFDKPSVIVVGLLRRPSAFMLFPKSRSSWLAGTGMFGWLGQRLATGGINSVDRDSIPHVSRSSNRLCPEVGDASEEVAEGLWFGGEARE